MSAVAATPLHGGLVTGNRGRSGAPSPSAAARKARALDMLAAGVRVADVAAELGVHPRTVGRWQTAAQLGAKVEASTKATEESRAEAIERGRERLERAVAGAVQTVVELSTGTPVAAEGAPGERLRLQAALAVLDRVGLHAKAGIEHDVGASSLMALVDAVAGATNGVKSGS